MTATKNILVLVLTLMTSSLFAQPPGGGNFQKIKKNPLKLFLRVTLKLCRKI